MEAVSALTSVPDDRSSAPARPRAQSVLVVDDEVRSLEALTRTLEEEFTVFTASTAEEALEVLRREFVTIILCDQRMPGMPGVAFLKKVRAEWPDPIRIVISGYTDAEDIIAGVNEAGIWQYLLKPWHPEQLLLTLRSAVEVYRLQREHQRLSLELRDAPVVLKQQVEAKRAQARQRFAADAIVRAPDSPLERVCELVERIAPHDLSVLITGESGTGKELVARALHYGSGRGARPFVIENCGALPDELLESELFGHKRGAFTGAYEDRLGLFQEADGGTIFLDEIGDTSAAFQVKLLRALQEGEIRPVGSSRTLSVDVRVVAATNRDLDEDVRTGRFREDLYYRIATVTLPLPPLRDRPMDIEPLARSILERSRAQLRLPVEGFTPEAMACLKRYRWPGNGRELQNEVQRMLALADGPWLGAELLSPRVLHAAAEGQERDLSLLAGLDGTLKERIEQLEARILRETLLRHRWNKTRAAQELGLSRVGLRSKLARYQLERS
ncbi:sigma-54-dependent transcriptional regulator [Anaeromyxobacter diazotrophicus]|uniref:Hydrogenase transcriptional regulatory protein HoxA n=1 Tax=Anaeromyxobacter diazotrophicus TaxID=2590199 RepID=A0A7I9VGM8_9BACT|nr:sigma-54 dependent transcriptional regulator [Anaeromyxobacter diazotrophicus]GEJ55290.1 hydrogenase transcriptional regulatory protein HoxA [Anaeromyxobacter diazotrophicus]